MSELLRPYVTREEHQAQWDTGWPDFHPEAYCQRCLNRNIKSWYVDGPLWMQAVDRGTEIFCPQCFTELHAEATGDWQTWEIRPAQRPDQDLTSAILAILEGNLNAHPAYLAHRIAIEFADSLAKEVFLTVTKDGVSAEVLRQQRGRFA